MTAKRNHGPAWMPAGRMFDASWHRPIESEATLHSALDRLGQVMATGDGTNAGGRYEGNRDGEWQGVGVRAHDGARATFLDLLARA